MKVTFKALADNLVCASQVLMGEANERTPVILIRNAPICLSDQEKTQDMNIEPKLCLYSSLLKGKID